MTPQQIEEMIAAAVEAIPPSSGRADIRRRVLTTALEGRSITRRRSRWLVLVPTTVLLLGGGIAVAARDAAPGDPLYSLRRGLSAARVAVALGDRTKAVALLDRAEGSLLAAERLAREGRESKAEKALRVFRGDLAAGQAEIARLEPGERGELEARASALQARAATLAALLARDDRSGSSGGDSSGKGSEDSGDDSLGSGSSGDDPSGGGDSSGPGSGDDTSGSGSGDDSSGSGSSGEDSGSSGGSSSEREGSDDSGSHDSSDASGGGDSSKESGSEEEHD